MAKFLRKKGLSVRSGTSRKQTRSVDYVIDAFGDREAVYLAQKQKAKYLRLVIGEQVISPPQEINWRAIRTDFLIGPQMPTDSFLGQLIAAAIKNQVLELPELDSKKISPLHVNDLAEAVWQALVLPETAGKEFLVLGPPVELEKLASFLEQLGQTTKGTHFSSQKKIIQYPLPQAREDQEKLSWQPKIDWREAIERTFRSLWKKIEPEKTISPIEKPKKPIEPKGKEPEKSKKEFKEEIIVVEEPVEEKLEPEPEEARVRLERIISQLKEEEKEPEPSFQKRKFSWKKFFLGVFFSLLLIEAFIWIKPVICLGLGSRQLKKTLDYLLTQNWNQAEKAAQKAKDQFSQGEGFVKNHPFKFLLFGADKNLGQISEVGEKIALASKNAIPLAQNSLQVSEAVLKDKEVDFDSKIKEIEIQLRQLNSELTVIEALLKAPWTWLPARWKNLPRQWAKKTETARQFLSQSEKLIKHLPWAFGLNNEKRIFLVLLQNNMELRATGGFIGSFALLTFEDGVLIDFETKDVYTADGQLKGHVEPPKEIKEILGEANWYLRDSNWNPDFTKTAKNAEWFLNKELGREVDGVIGFNLEAAKKLVGAFGEIYLPDFNEKINSNNLFERAEFWSENKFFPGSTQKAAFLGLLGQQLFENIKAAQPEEYFKVSRAILESLDEKEILVFVHDSSLAKALYQLNWDGSVRSPECSLDNCYSDYLYLVESNLGVNKANYFIRRSLEKKVELKENGQINHQLKIHYENTAISESWPGGKYVNWLRIYFPKETKIEEITAYNSLNAQERKTVTSEDRTEEIKDDKEIIGFRVDIPIKQRWTLEINYQQEWKPNQEKFAYFLYWQKQSGYQETPISLLVSFPQGWQPVQVNPAANLISGQLLFNQQLNKDLNFGLELSK